jgi:cell wall-associated NlpC family hydrolase
MFARPHARMKKAKSHLKGKKANSDPGSDSRRKRHENPIQKKILFIAATAVAAVILPVVFAMAGGSGEVSNAVTFAQVQTQDPSYEAVPSPSWTNQILDSTSDGELKSDLTDTTVQAEATAIPSPAPATEPAAEPTPAPSPEPVYSALSSGMNDPFVAVIQQRLMDLDYMEHDETTTLLGPITTQAIEYFQRKNGLPIDGVASVETQTVLFSDSARYYTVSKGADGPDVESIQQRLAELGYPATADGVFGPSTTKAVEYFQRMNGLADDGNVGSDTREALYSKDAEPSLEYVKKASTGSKKSSGNADSSSLGKSNSGSDSNVSAPAPAANPGDREAFVQAALSQLGKKYVWGGKGPNVFDCSGFVYYALKISGNGINYMTSAGWHNSGYTKIEKMEDLQRGDIIDYKGHVGIYLGDGTMVDASSSEGKVRISGNIFNSSYWTSHFLEGRRLF